MPRLAPPLSAAYVTEARGRKRIIEKGGRKEGHFKLLANREIRNLRAIWWKTKKYTFNSDDDYFIFRSEFMQP